MSDPNEEVHLINEEEERQLNAWIKYYEDYIERKYKTNVQKLWKKCKVLWLKMWSKYFKKSKKNKVKTKK